MWMTPLVSQCFERLSVSFVAKVTKTKKRMSPKEPAPEIKSTVVLPYVKGLSETSPLPTTTGHTNCSHIRHDTMSIQENKMRVVNKISCECSKLYIGETGRSMLERIKER